MATLTRRIKKPEDETRKNIYRCLTRPITFDKLVRSSRTNRVTLSQCLAYGIEQGEIEHHSRRGPYLLTAKGQVELNRAEAMQQIREQLVEYDDELDFSAELVDLSDDTNTACAILDESLQNPPLPVKIKATVYGNDPTSLDDVKSRVLLRDYNLGRKKVAREILRALTYPSAKRLVWGCILSHVWALMELHRAYKGRGEWSGATENLLAYDRRKGQPPPLDLDNIIGFDITMTMRYEGTKLRGSKETQDLVEKRQMDKRLTGSLLLQIAEIEGTDPSVLRDSRRPCYYDMIPLLERGGLLNDDDVRIIHSGRIVEVALRYLEEGGVLKVPRGQTPRQLAREYISWSREQEPRPYVIPNPSVLSSVNGDGRKH